MAGHYIVRACAGEAGVRECSVVFNKDQSQRRSCIYPLTPPSRTPRENGAPFTWESDANPKWERPGHPSDLFLSDDLNTKEGISSFWGWVVPIGVEGGHFYFGLDPGPNGDPDKH